MQEIIKEKILKNAFSLYRFGVNELAWDKEAAKSLIDSLMLDDIGILGGNVFKLDSNHLVPLYDNWSCNAVSGEARKKYYFRSKVESIKYIDNYKIYPNELILFAIGFTENIEI